MSYETLIQQQSGLQEEIDAIKAQLDHATARLHTTGEYSDPQWYARAKAALRHKQRQMQALQQAIGRRAAPAKRSVSRQLNAISWRRHDAGLLQIYSTSC